MMTPRRAIPDRLRGAALRSALVLVLFAPTACSLVLDPDGLDVPDAQGVPVTHLDAAGADDASDAGDASADARGAMEAGPADGTAEATKDAEPDADAGARDGGGGQDSRADAPIDASDDHAGDAGDAAGPDAPATDGAPTDAPSVGPDANPDGCSVVTHTNGVGETWEDCNPLATRNRNEAQSACNALATGGGCVAQSACNFSYVGVSVSDGNGGMTTYLWIYSTQSGARPNPGDVLAYPSGTAQCNNLPRRTATWQ
jgi:hypothetical protein